MQRLNAVLEPVIHVLFRLSGPAHVDLGLVSFPHELEADVCTTPHVLRDAVRDDAVQSIIADPLRRTMVSPPCRSPQHPDGTVVAAGLLQRFGIMGDDGIGWVCVGVAVAAGVVKYVFFVLVELIVIA